MIARGEVSVNTQNFLEHLFFREKAYNICFKSRGLSLVSNVVYANAYGTHVFGTPGLLLPRELSKACKSVSMGNA